MTEQQSIPAMAPPATTAAADFFRYEAQFIEVVPIGAVPAGLRIDAHFAGSVIEGPLAGATVRGIDYVLIRADGVSALDVREVITTAAGGRIEVRAQGYGQGRAGAALPPLEVLQSPEFRWPDAPVPILGAAYCQTAAPKLAWLNRTVFVYTGTVNLGTGELHVAVRALTPEMVLGPPMGQGT